MTPSLTVQKELQRTRIDSLAQAIQHQREIDLQSERKGKELVQATTEMMFHIVENHATIPAVFAEYLFQTGGNFASLNAKGENLLEVICKSSKVQMLKSFLLARTQLINQCYTLPGTVRLTDFGFHEAIGADCNSRKSAKKPTVFDLLAAKESDSKEHKELTEQQQIIKVMREWLKLRLVYIDTLESVPRIYAYTELGRAFVQKIIQEFNQDPSCQEKTVARTLDAMLDTIDLHVRITVANTEYRRQQAEVKTRGEATQEFIEAKMQAEKRTDNASMPVDPRYRSYINKQIRKLPLDYIADTENQRRDMRILKDYDAILKIVKSGPEYQGIQKILDLIHTSEDSSVSAGDSKTSSEHSEMRKFLDSEIVFNKVKNQLLTLAKKSSNAQKIEKIYSYIDCLPGFLLFLSEEGLKDLYPIIKMCIEEYKLKNSIKTPLRWQLKDTKGICSWIDSVVNPRDSDSYLKPRIFEVRQLPQEKRIPLQITKMEFRRVENNNNIVNVYFHATDLEGHDDFSFRHVLVERFAKDDLAPFQKLREFGVGSHTDATCFGVMTKIRMPTYNIGFCLSKIPKPSLSLLFDLFVKHQFLLQQDADTLQAICFNVKDAETRIIAMLQDKAVASVSGVKP